MNILEEYRMLGYALAECSFKRTPKTIFHMIRINVSNAILNKENKQFTISYNIQLNSTENTLSLLKYDAVFIIPDDRELIDELITSTEKKENKFNFSEETTNKILMMIRTSFPYIRQALSNMTNDLNGAINIPTIDVQMLLHGGIEFNRIPNTDTPDSNKKVKRKYTKKPKTEK